MEKQTPFLDFYNARVAAGKLDSVGLCNSSISLLEPFRLIKGCGQLGFWAYDNKYFCTIIPTFRKHCKKRKITEDQACYELTPLRQTIILLCAAINGEL